MSLTFLKTLRFLRQLKVNEGCVRCLNVGSISFCNVHNASKAPSDAAQFNYKDFQASLNGCDVKQNEKSIVFNECSDRFGTLSSDRMMREKVESGEETGDVIETTYIDGIQGKTRLKPINYAMIIKNLLEEKKLADALAVLEDTMLIKHKAKPDLYIYNLLISGCGKHGYTKKAFKLFNQMKKRGIIPRLSTYTSLFNACAQGPWDHDSLERARYLREHMKEKQIEPNSKNYNAMIKAFGRHGDLETSFLIMDEMISKKIAIDSVTFNFLLQAAASDKEGGFRHALLVWKKMMEKKILPTIFTFNLLLRCTRDCGCGNVNSTRELISLLSGPENEMVVREEQNDKSVNVQGPNMLIPLIGDGSLVSVSSGLDKPWHRLMLLGDLKGVLSTLDKFKSKPDIKTFSLLLNILPNSDDMEKVLINEMIKRNIKIDTDFCNMLIKKRNCSSRFASALEVLNIMAKNKLQLNIVSFGVLALGCNTLRSAKQLISDIKGVGFRVNNEILTALINRSKASLNIDMVLFVINTLLSEDIVPDQQFYDKLIVFRDIAYINLEAKGHGKGHLSIVDSEDFDKKFSKFLKHLENIKNNIKDPSTIHPWAQYKKVPVTA